MARLQVLADRERPQMYLLRLVKSAFVGIKDREIVQHRSNIGMVRSELLFINLQSAQIIGFGGLLPARLTENERDVVKHGPDVGIGDVLNLASSSYCFLVKVDRFIGLTKTIEEEGQSSRRAVDGALIWRGSLFKDRVRLQQICFRSSVISLLFEQLAEFFKARGKCRLVPFECTSGNFKGCFGDPNCLEAGD